MKTSLILFASFIFATASAYADVCYTGKYAIPGRKSAIMMSFKVEISPEKASFSSVLLNPDEVIGAFENGKEKNLLAKEIVSSDADIRLHALPGSDEKTIIYGSEKGDVKFMVKDAGDSFIPRLDYFGVSPVNMLDFSACETK